MSSASEHSGRSAAVTGAGGGLGRDIALGLAAKGYVVFGTAVSAAEVEDLKKVSGGRVSLAVCDITKEQAVKAWAGGVSDALGNGGLDLNSQRLVLRLQVQQRDLHAGIHFLGYP